MRRLQHEAGIRTVRGEGRLLLRVAAPEDEGHRLRQRSDSAHGGVGERLPAERLMAGRLARLHAQAAVEQKHALPCPHGQIAAVRRRDIAV